MLTGKRINLYKIAGVQIIRGTYKVEIEKV